MPHVTKAKPGTSLYERQTLSQIRRQEAAAERDELRNKVFKGQLVLKELIEKERFHTGRQVRDALENVAARIAGLVAAEKNQDKCFAIIEREIRQALEGLTT